MIVVNKKSFAKGSLFMISFVAVFTLILMPIFPGEKDKVTGLDYADNLFNRLSKGSSWFVPDITPRVKAMEGKEIDVTVPLKKAASADAVVKLFTANGATSNAEGGLVRVKADFGKLLGAVLVDCEAIYNDKPEAVSAKYGMDGGKSLAFWWDGLQPMIKELQKMKRISEAQLLDTVIRKGIEPAYNFRGIAVGSVKQEFAIMLALLVFYVVYTLWYGFAIFDLFEGIGLTMKKGKKQEA
jgi:hypothetical protein